MSQTFPPAALEHIVRRFTWATIGGGLDLDDLRQVGREAAEVAYRRHDPACGAAENTFAYRRALQQVTAFANEQRMSMRVPYGTAYQRRKRGQDVPKLSCASVDVRPPHAEDLNPLDLTDHVTAANEFGIDAQRLPHRVAFTLRRVAAELGADHRGLQVLVWRMHDDLSLAECGERLGCTGERARQILELVLDEFARQWALAGWDRP